MTPLFHRVTVVAFTAAAIAALSACGGGGSGASYDDNQQINTVQARPLAYSQQAVINVGGLFLSSGMTATSGACSNPVFNAAQSSPTFAVLNCTITATGVQPLVITGVSGKVLYTGTLTVPQPRVEVVTSQGNFGLELNPTAAPLTVNNFLAYTANGYYTGTLMHRVIAGFVAQGGGYTTGLVKKPTQRLPIELETDRGLLNIRGSLAMARTSVPNSATSEFYVNLVDNPSLNYQSPISPGYAVFGKVVTGMDVIDKIAALPTTTVNGFGDVPTPEVVIQFVLQTQ